MAKNESLGRLPSTAWMIRAALTAAVLSVVAAIAVEERNSAARAEMASSEIRDVTCVRAKAIIIDSAAAQGFDMGPGGTYVKDGVVMHLRKTKQGIAFVLQDEEGDEVEVGSVTCEDECTEDVCSVR